MCFKVRRSIGIVKVAGVEVLATKLVSPLYLAVMVFVPFVANVALKMAPGAAVPIGAVPA